MSPKYSTGNASLLHNNELTAKDLQFSEIEFSSITMNNLQFSVKIKSLPMHLKKGLIVQLKW
jgi:hypothetical protein